MFPKAFPPKMKPAPAIKSKLPQTKQQVDAIKSKLNAKLK